MGPNPRSQVEQQIQKAKLAGSYNALLEEFASKELRTVGNYSVGKLIGKGSFGKVYLASHKLINGSKVVLKSASKDDSNLAREIHHHRQFLHPHIARLYEVIVTETSVWLVLEYCPGDELYYYLTKHGAMEPAKVQKTFAQLVGAVSYVHGKSCVHRDLKLENILLDKNEDVKLCDFGFTREYEGKSSYLQTWCGTVCYSAPEMLRGDKYAGEKVDVWSLGIILYALLCGELPFDEDEDDKTKAKILQDEPRYPDTLPPPARDLIRSMLSKRPLLRPSLADILTNAWLMDFAPQQQAVLKLQQPAPFGTQLEKDVLQRMRSAGVNIDAVIENVLSQRCDGLAGWWALLLEKEDRKEQRRLLKRKERELDARASRRISTASGQLLAVAIQEEKSKEMLAEMSAPDQRGRSPGRWPGDAESDGPAASSTQSPPEPPPEPSSTATATRTDHHRPTSRPMEHRVHRPASSSRTRRRSVLTGTNPALGNKRSSMLHVVSAEAALANDGDGGAGGGPKGKRRKYHPLILSRLSNIKSWFRDPSKALKSQERPGPTKNGADKAKSNGTGQTSGTTLKNAEDAHAEGGGGGPGSGDAVPPRPQVRTHASSGSMHRLSSHSPSPITPKSSYRRSTGSNMRRRKSTSSSVSSIRSFHVQHNPTHSKASSISSDMGGSPSTLTVAAAAAAMRRRSSPNNSSIKVLPAQKRTPSLILVPESNAAGGGGAFSGFGPPSPGIVFAKRRRTPFQGPKLGPGTRRRSDGNGLGVELETFEDSGGALPHSQARKSNELAIHREEDEDEYEEVDAFTPVGLGESVEFEHDTSIDLDRDRPLTKWELEN